MFMGESWGGSGMGNGDLCMGISPMTTSMKSTHERDPFKDSAARLYIASLCYK